MISIDKDKVKNNFGKSAETYDQYAKVQKIMAMKLLNQILAENKEFDDILEIGCGTGFLTEKLAREFPRARIVAIDISPEMIKVAKRKLAAYPNITYLVGDGEKLAIEKSFNLIVSSAVFQWFENYLESFSLYYSLLKEGGRFIFNTLGSETFRELEEALAELGKITTAKKFTQAENLHQVLSTCGFKGVRVKEEILRDYYSSARKLLLGIKKIGATTPASIAQNTNLEDGNIFRLSKIINSRYCDNRGVYLSYEIIYGYGVKN